MIKKIWEGVYRSFQEAPAYGEGFSSKQWMNQSLSKIVEIESHFKKNEAGQISVHQDINFLLPVVAALLKNKKKALNILDFGGGMGISFFPIRNHIGTTKKFGYHIVEVEKICETAAEHLAIYENLVFHTSFPKEIDFDIVHMGSSLHYIEDWKKVLTRLCQYQAESFLICDLPLGNHDSFVTIQNYYESKIPVWFFNRSIIIRFMENNGYQLIYDEAGNELPLKNFEERYRIDATSNLLFQRIDPDIA